jgi:hypothetical protein
MSAGTLPLNRAPQPSAAAVSSDTVVSGDFAVTLQRVEDLRREESEDDQPSGYAYERTLEVLIKAGRELGLRFPRASASVGPNRGLRITWSYGLKEVRLICAGIPGSKSYIYSECGLQHAVDYYVDGGRLAQHLMWALAEL